MAVTINGSGPVTGSDRAALGTNSDITSLTALASVNGGQLAGLRNRIINGGMEIAQRGASFAGVNNGYPVDRFVCGGGTTALFTLSQQTDTPSSNEFQNSLRIAVTTADTSIAASDYMRTSQFIEGYNVRDLIGRTFTLSFWVRSSKTGTHCVSFRNSIGDRSYVTEYTVNASNTWEYKTITVTGGLIIAGTWNWTNGTGLDVSFMLSAGTTYQTTANAWQTGNFLATANQVNCLDTVGNIFAITGVQLEVGSVATTFEQRPYGMELALCQRYYYKTTSTSVNSPFGPAWGYLTTQAYATVQFPVSMRIAPQALIQSGTATDYGVFMAATPITCSSVPTFAFSTTENSLIAFFVASGIVVGQGGYIRGLVSTAYLGWSAEL